MKPPPTDQVVLGIDPGLATTGWSVVEKGVSIGLRLRSFGAIETSASADLPSRLTHLHRSLLALIETHRPQTLALEELFFTKFASSIAATAQARGVILLAAAQCGLDVAPYNPRAVKMALTGFGSAGKSQMQTMLQRFFQLSELPRPDDAADAAAIALCHLQTKPELRVRVSRRSRIAWEAALAARAGVML